MSITNAEACRNFRRRLRNEGMCVHCKKLSVTYLCKKCYALKKADPIYMRNTRIKRKLHNLCTRCGKKRDNTGYVLCSVCLDYIQEWRKQHSL